MIKFVFIYRTFLGAVLSYFSKFDNNLNVSLHIHDMVAKNGGTMGYDNTKTFT